MKRLPLALLFLASGLVACPSDSSNFPRDGVVDDDDDATTPGNPHGDLVAGDRIAWWDIIRSSPFNANNPIYTSTAAFFGPRVLNIPTPDLESCFLNNVDEDPWDAPESENDYGTPYVWLDGLQEDLSLPDDGDVWQATLSGGFWQDGADVRLGVSGGDVFPGGSFWPGAMSLPDALIGQGASYDAQTGLTMQWEAGVPENTLEVIVTQRGSGPTTTYVACRANDDGEFTIPADDLAGFPGDEIEVWLRRERLNDDWRVFPDGAGRVMGISQLRGEFTLSAR